MVVAPHAAWLLPCFYYRSSWIQSTPPSFDREHHIMFSVYLYLLIVYTISVRHCLSNGILSFFFNLRVQRRVLTHRAADKFSKSKRHWITLTSSVLRFSWPSEIAYEIVGCQTKVLGLLLWQRMRIARTEFKTEAYCERVGGIVDPSNISSCQGTNFSQ